MLNTFTSPRLKDSIKFMLSADNTKVLTLALATIAASVTLNVPDPGSTDTLTYNNLAATLLSKTLGSSCALGANLAAGGYKITGAADPTSAQDYVTLAYLQSYSMGFDVHTECQWATAAPLPSCTYSAGVLTATANGAIAVDSGSPALNDRVIVKNQVTAKTNGVFDVTTVGDGSNPWVLTRATDFNTTGLVDKLAIFWVSEGTTNATTQWTSPLSTVVLDTDPIVFTQFSGGSTYTNGNGLNLSGNAFSIKLDGSTLSLSSSGVKVSDTYGGNGSLATVGTITSGTWNGTAVALAYLDSSVVSLTGTQTLTNKTLTSPIVTTPLARQKEVFSDLSSSGGSYTVANTDRYVFIKAGTHSITVTMPTPTSALDGQEVYVALDDTATGGNLAFSAASGSLKGPTGLDNQNDGYTWLCDYTNTCWRNVS